MNVQPLQFSQQECFQNKGSLEEQGWTGHLLLFQNCMEILHTFHVKQQDLRPAWGFESYICVTIFQTSGVILMSYITRHFKMTQVSETLHKQS